MHVVRAEGTARAAQGVTASQTAARWLTSAACATEAESPRAPAIATETCWTNAGYVQMSLFVKKSARTSHRSYLIARRLKLHLTLYDVRLLRGGIARSLSRDV